MWLHARDDVATALRALAAGEAVHVRCGDAARTVVVNEAIPLGHKIALRPLERGTRIRKYGEFIGRLTANVPEGAWVHSHNLATAARRTAGEELAWRGQAAPAKIERVALEAVPTAVPARSGDGRTEYIPHAAHGYVLARSTVSDETRVFADLGGLPGEPVAAAVDAEDHVWIALAGGGALLRYAPDGALSAVMRIPAEYPARLAFGAAGTRTLFVITRAGDTAASRASNEAQAFVVDAGVDALPAARGT